MSAAATAINKNDDVSNCSTHKSVFINTIPVWIYPCHMKYQKVNLKYKDVNLLTPFKIILKTKVGCFTLTKMTKYSTAISIDGNELEPEFGYRGYNVIVDTPFDDIVDVIGEGGNGDD